MIPVDTNILLRYADPKCPAHADVCSALTTLWGLKDGVGIAPQNLYEFWVAGTRPTSVNGLGLTPAGCEQFIADFRRRFTHLPEPPDLLDRWLTLVVAHQCRGKVAHDARLVAALQSHGLDRILTLNPADFRRFPGLTPLTPADVLAP